MSAWWADIGLLPAHFPFLGPPLQDGLHFYTVCTDQESPCRTHWPFACLLDFSLSEWI